MPDEKTKDRPWWCPDIREILAVIVVVGGGYIVWHKPTLESAVMLAIGGILGYYFGTSMGSQRKTELLAKAQVVEEKKCCCKE